MNLSDQKVYMGGKLYRQHENEDQATQGLWLRILAVVGFVAVGVLVLLCMFAGHTVQWQDEHGNHGGKR